MVLFARGAAALTGPLSAGMLHGLQVAAVAVVAQAVWSMAVSLCPDRPRATIAVAATLIVTAAPTALGQIAAILAGAVAGAWLLPRGAGARRRPRGCRSRCRGALAVAALALFAMLLIGLPIAAAVSPVPGARDGGRRSTGPARSSSAGDTSCCRCCTPRWWSPAG